MLSYGIVLFLVLSLLLWAYFSMINIRPRVERPTVERIAEHHINDLEARLRGHVVFFAGEVGERNVSTLGNLNKTVDYIRNFWQECGHAASLRWSD